MKKKIRKSGRKVKKKKNDEYDRPIEGTKKKRRYKVHVRRKKNKSEYYHTQKVSIFIEEFN